MSEHVSTLPEEVVDAQDPLPESNWIPRRWFAFLGLLLLIAIKAFETWLGRQSWMTDALIFSVIVVYMIAPSAEQLVKLVQTASLFRAGVTFKSEKQISSSAQTSDEITRTEMGQHVGEAGPELVQHQTKPLVEPTDEPIGEADNLPDEGLVVPSHDAPFYTGSSNPSSGSARRAGGEWSGVPESGLG